MTDKRKKIKKQLKKLKPSAIVNTFDNKEEIILRDWLAMQRTTLANERTLFAYVRSSLYLIIGGITLLQVEMLENIVWLGYAAFGISAFMLVYGITRYLALRRKLRPFYRDSDKTKKD